VSDLLEVTASLRNPLAPLLSPFTKVGTDKVVGALRVIFVNV